MNIYEKLLTISNELSIVAKNLEVGIGQARYKATGEADVLKAIKPLELKHKIYSYPYSRTIVESGTIENVTSKGEVKKSLFLRIEVVYRFINVEKPDEFIDITTYGDGVDTQDKAVGKAMTYADKYALLKAYKIITGDDPDQDPSGDLKGKKTTNKPLDPTLLAQCEELKIDLAKVAVYLKKKVEDLTDADLKACIEQKQKAMGGKK